MKKRPVAIVLALLLLFGSFSASFTALADEGDIAAELSQDAVLSVQEQESQEVEVLSDKAELADELLPLSADLFDFTIPADMEYTYTINLGYPVAQQQPAVTVSVKDTTEGVGSPGYVKYIPFENGSWNEAEASFAAPKYAGTYRVTVDVSEGSAYQGGTVVLSDEYIISKKTLTRDDFMVGGFYTGYNGKDKSADVKRETHQNGCTFVCDFRTGELLFKKYNTATDMWDTVSEVVDLGRYQVWAKSVVAGSDGELVNIEQIPVDSPVYLKEFDIVEGTWYGTEYSVKIPGNSQAVQTEMLLDDVFRTSGDSVPRDAEIKSGTISGALFGLESEAALSINSAKNGFYFTPAQELGSEMTGTVAFTMSAYGYADAEITVSFGIDPKLSRDDAEYDITVASTNTDTTVKTVALSDIIGEENVPSENVTIAISSELGDISDIISDYSFTDSIFRYTPVQRPADGKAGTLVYVVSSDDYNDFTITFNLASQDTRAEIEDINFEELAVDPVTDAGEFYGYSLEDVAAAAFDSAAELIDGFEYHGVSFSENAEAVLKESETYYTDNWGGYFVFTFQEPLDRGNTAWVRYEVSSNKYKPFGLILYFTVPKLERTDASHSITLDAYAADRDEQSVSISELLGGKKVPQKNLRVSYVSASDNLYDVVETITYEDNSLIYTPAEGIAVGDMADITFNISSGDYEDFELIVYFNAADGRRVHNDVTYTVNISHNNTDTAEKSLTVADIFGGAEKLPEGLVLDSDAKTVSENITNALSEYTVTENGIVYCAEQEPVQGTNAKIEIPACAPGYKDFKVTVIFKVSSVSKGPYAFVVHFDTDGGSRIENKVVSRGKRLEKPANPKKDGFTFGGWYTTAEFEKEYDFTRSVGRNFTLYAKWVPTSSGTVKDEENDGGGGHKLVYRVIFTIDKKEADIFGDSVTYDVAPIIVNSRTMLSARYVAENLGAKVEWDASVGDGKVTITKGNTEIILLIGEMYAYVNGEKVDLDVEPFIQNSRTYYPARFIAERLGASVEWNEQMRTVTISTTEKPVWNPKYAD